MTQNGWGTPLDHWTKIFNLFQHRVGEWVEGTFGKSWIESTEERQLRFLEESFELVQATGLSKERAQELLEYVYSRPLGEPKQEVGGVCITLLALCHNLDIKASDALQVEFNKIYEQSTIDKVRRKTREKIKRGVCAPNLEVGK